MSTSEWDYFCDGVDKVLKPRKQEEIIFPSLITIVILLAFFLFAICMDITPSNTPEIVFLLFFLVVKYGGRHLILICEKVKKKMISRVRIKVKQNLKNFLDTESAKHRAKNISFLYRVSCLQS